MTEKHTSVICIITSLFMLTIPLVFDRLLDFTWEYSRRTFTVWGMQIFRYASVVLVGLIIVLHFFSVVSCSMKKWAPHLLCVMLAAETVLLNFSKLYGNLFSCFFLVIVLAEIFLQKTLSRNGD